MNLNDYDARIEEPYMILDDTGKVVDKDSFIYYIETMDLFTSDITSKQLIFK